MKFKRNRSEVCKLIQRKSLFGGDKKTSPPSSSDESVSMEEEVGGDEGCRTGSVLRCGAGGVDKMGEVLLLW